MRKMVYNESQFGKTLQSTMSNIFATVEKKNLTVSWARGVRMMGHNYGTK